MGLKTKNTRVLRNQWRTNLPMAPDAERSKNRKIQLLCPSGIANPESVKGAMVSLNSHPLGAVKEKKKEGGEKR